MLYLKKTMKRYSTADNPKNIEIISSFLKDYMGSTGMRNLSVFVKQGRIDLEFPECDPYNEFWDGTLLIHFKQDFTPAEVVNYILAFSRADEISFVNDKTLRMWWD
jgi:hypothetical protein